MKKKFLVWDVDTQYDFMKPDGKLYVDGAEEIIDRVSEIRIFALKNGFPLIASTDWHTRKDKEIEEEPDYKETYPQHCMAGDPGAERVGQTGEMEIDIIENREMDRKELKRILSKDLFHAVIRKNATNVFTNPNTESMLDIIVPRNIIVFGVALDVCVYYTVLELMDRTGASLRLIKDAVRAIDPEKGDDAMEAFAARGVRIQTFDEMKAAVL